MRNKITFYAICLIATLTTSQTSAQNLRECAQMRYSWDILAMFTETLVCKPSLSNTGNDDRAYFKNEKFDENFRKTQKSSNRGIGSDYQKVLNRQLDNLNSTGLTPSNNQPLATVRGYDTTHQ